MKYRKKLLRKEFAEVEHAIVEKLIELQTLKSALSGVQFDLNELIVERTALADQINEYIK